jgi:hypothetical protein
MEHLLDEQETQPANKRPVFLTVLCILTWVGSAICFALYAYQYILYNSFHNSLKEMASNPLYDPSTDLTNPFRWMVWSALIACAGALICAGAAVVMWKRRKWGFYVYLAGEVIPLVVTTYATFTMGRSIDPISLAIMAVWWIVPIGFIVMYALNLKHMKR